MPTIFSPNIHENTHRANKIKFKKFVYYLKASHDTSGKPNLFLEASWYEINDSS